MNVYVLLGFTAITEAFKYPCGHAVSWQYCSMQLILYVALLHKMEPNKNMWLHRIKFFFFSLSSRQECSCFFICFVLFFSPFLCYPTESDRESILLCLCHSLLFASGCGCIWCQPNQINGEQIVWIQQKELLHAHSMGEAPWVKVEEEGGGDSG